MSLYYEGDHQSEEAFEDNINRSFPYTQKSKVPGDPDFDYLDPQYVYEKQKQKGE